MMKVKGPKINIYQKYFIFADLLATKKSSSFLVCSIPFVNIIDILTTSIANSNI